MSRKGNVKGKKERWREGGRERGKEGGREEEGRKPKLNFKLWFIN